MLIREATADDVPAVVQVHLDSWDAAKEGLDLPTRRTREQRTEHWTTLHAQAQSRTDADAAAVEARRVQLMTKAYKALDYHSPASDGLASVLGWTGANLMFDHVFGPDLEDQGLDHKRTYLEVEVSPGTFSAPRSH